TTQFRIDANALINQAIAALDSGDAGALDAALHTLKGVAATLGFASISTAADDLRHRPLTTDDLNSLLQPAA
ncbi:MAG: Hpt domain-containing protein, partial [Alphaproteobacteria bacterium]|nr:Hpt domain-containing protein [Alphaproteobacteria bacterium]